MIPKEPIPKKEPVHESIPLKESILNEESILCGELILEKESILNKESILLGELALWQFPCKVAELGKLRSVTKIRTNNGKIRTKLVHKAPSAA